MLENWDLAVYQNFVRKRNCVIVKNSMNLQDRKNLKASGTFHTGVQKKRSFRA